MVIISKTVFAQPPLGKEHNVALTPTLSDPTGTHKVEARRPVWGTAGLIGSDPSEPSVYRSILPRLFRVLKD
jgi:hypothetical protein